jgi:type I restriction enzyme S subunit
MIPGWSSFKLGDPDIATIILGQSPPSETYNVASSGLPFFQGKADFGVRNPRVRTWCSDPVRIADPDDVLISVRAPVGDVNIADQRCAIGRGLAAIRPSALDSEFLYYALIHGKPQLEAEGTGSTFESINRYTLDNFVVFAPTDIREQRGVAAVLRKLQRRSQIEASAASTLTALKVATMAKLFREGLRAEPLKQTEVGEIPDSWGLVPCERICDLITVGIVVTPVKYYVPSGVPCFRSFNVKPNRLVANNLVFISPSANEFHSKSMLHTGDVIAVRTGYPGTACVVPPEYNGANCIDLLIARPTKDVLIGEFLAAYLNSPEGKTQVAFQQGGLAQQHYNVGSFKRLLVPLPPNDEQNEIAEVVKSLEQRIIVAEQKVDALQALFSSTLQQLMTGALRVGAIDCPEVVNG